MIDPFPIYCRQVNCFSSGFGEFPQESKRRHIGILYINNSYYFSEVHTSYLSFLLHRQDFRKPNFTPKKTTKGTKNTKNVSEKVKYMHFFHSIWKNLHLTENFYTDMSVVSVTNMRYGEKWCQATET